MAALERHGTFRLRLDSGNAMPSSTRQCPHPPNLLGPGDPTLTLGSGFKDPSFGLGQGAHCVHLLPLTGPAWKDEVDGSCSRDSLHLTPRL